MFVALATVCGSEPSTTSCTVVGRPRVRSRAVARRDDERDARLAASGARRVDLVVARARARDVVEARSPRGSRTRSRDCALLVLVVDHRRHVADVGVDRVAEQQELHHRQDDHHRERQAIAPQLQQLLPRDHERPHARSRRASAARLGAHHRDERVLDRGARVACSEPTRSRCAERRRARAPRDRRRRAWRRAARGRRCATSSTSARARRSVGGVVRADRPRSPRRGARVARRSRRGVPTSSSSPRKMNASRWQRSASSM